MKIELLAVLFLIGCASVGTPNLNLVNGEDKFNYFSASHAVVVVRCLETEKYGTGFIVAPNFVITASHVTKGCVEVTVVYRSVLSQRASVVKTDPLYDLSLIRVEFIPDTARTIKFETKQPKLGEKVYIIHHTAQMFWSYSEGYIAFPARREIEINGVKRHTIQIHAVANAGASGSPVFNSENKVVGMLHACLGETEMVFIIPADIIHRWLK